MKNFNEIYEKIYQDSMVNDIETKRKAYLQESRKRTLYALVIAAIVITLLFLLEWFTILPFAIIISIFACCLMPLSKSGSYQKEYKSKVITSLVKYYDEHLYFNGELSIPRTTYNAAEFEGYDNFYSNDYIHGKLDGIIPIELGDVRTENEHTDSDGNTTYTTVFRGLFSSASLSKDLFNIIKIRSDKGKFAKLFSKKEQVEMDSQEFEKHFDVFSTDKILAVRILTSDIMNYMIDFKKNNKVTFEITLKNDHMYIRIHCADMFEGKMSQSAIDFETLHKYYKFLDFMCELNRKIYNVIQEKDI